MIQKGIQMEIKRYDIVEFHGERHRVMYVDRRDDTIYISGYNRWIGIQDVQLLESVEIPIFKSGDEVVIKPIPTEEKVAYTTGWDDQMDDMVGNQYTHVIEDCFVEDGAYQINDIWFAAYHLESTPTYDIV